jgi:hypothetical protein
MGGRRLRELAFQCFVAARDTCEPIIQDDYLAIAARLVRRANEKDGLIPSVAVTKQAPKVSLPDAGTVPRSK